jgi:hypothetical protein
MFSTLGVAQSTTIFREIRTNTLGQIRYRLTNSDSGISVALTTHSWIDDRGFVGTTVSVAAPVFSAWVLVNEWDLSSEILDELISWDGETNNQIRIETSCSGSSILMHLNDDQTTNYNWASVYQDGSTPAAAKGTGPGIYVSSGDITYTETNGVLDNTGNPRLFNTLQSANVSGFPNMLAFHLGQRWENTEDDVTSIRFKTASSITGWIKVYRWHNFGV